MSFGASEIQFRRIIERGGIPPVGLLFSGLLDQGVDFGLGARAPGGLRGLAGRRWLARRRAWRRRWRGFGNGSRRRGRCRNRSGGLLLEIGGRCLNDAQAAVRKRDANHRHPVIHAHHGDGLPGAQFHLLPRDIRGDSAGQNLLGVGAGSTQSKRQRAEARGSHAKPAARSACSSPCRRKKRKTFFVGAHQLRMEFGFAPLSEHHGKDGVARVRWSFITRRTSVSRVS